MGTRLWSSIPRLGWLTSISLFLAANGVHGASVVINEIMYHPADDQETLQYVELFNAGETEADLAGWNFSKGITFTFATGTKLAPRAFLVVARKRADFSKAYGSRIPVAGDFQGTLSHNGERLELMDGESRVMDTVTYADKAPWPMAPDGESASLERICPTAGSGPENWAPSRFSPAPRPAGSPGRVNDSFSASLPTSFAEITLSPSTPAPNQVTTVRVSIADPDRLQSVSLLYRVMRAGNLGSEVSLPMQRVAGDEFDGKFEAAIPAQPSERLIRYRIRAVDGAGTERIFPSTNELRPALSYSTFLNTNQARIPFGMILHSVAATPRRPSGPAPPVPATRGSNTFIYLPPDGGAVEAFDQVEVVPRKGGFKIRFLKDQTLRGMSAVNVFFEDLPRRVLSEPFSYELYRLAGVPAELNDHIRLWVDGKPVGYNLLVEQPNKSFLRRNGRDDTGNLYKLIWQGSGLVGQHEKKSNPTTGHDDLVEAVRNLGQLSGMAQWNYIDQHFNVTNFINYYAVNMCIGNWDGFHNNYFLYHDTGGTGRWEIYPWDEDKTWGDFDGAAPPYDWYTLPLNFGMNGFRGDRGGANGPWARQPGYLSGPLLANPEFRKRFLARLNEICQTVFTEAKLFPILDEMEKRLQPEVAVRARATSANPSSAQALLKSDIESLRRQVTNRRKFLLSELATAR